MSAPDISSLINSINSELASEANAQPIKIKMETVSINELIACMDTATQQETTEAKPSGIGDLLKKIHSNPL